MHSLWYDIQWKCIKEIFLLRIVIMNSMSTRLLSTLPRRKCQIVCSFSLSCSRSRATQAKGEAGPSLLPKLLGQQVVEPCWVAPFLDFYLEYHWIPPAPSLRRVWIFLGAQQEWAAAAALAAPSATAGEFNARHPSTLHTLRRKRADLGKKSTFSREFAQNMSDRDKPRWFWQSPKGL